MTAFRPTGFLDPLRPQTRVVYSIVRNSRPKHMSTALAILIISLLAGVSPTQAFILAGAMISYEVMSEIGYRLLPVRDEDIKIANILLLVLICTLSCSTYMLGGLLMIQQGTIADTVTGLTITFGIFAYVTTAYAPFPLFNFAQFGPGLLVLLWQINTIRLNEPTSSSIADWTLTGAVVALYTINLFETRGRTHSTSIELRKAQRQATSRLRELEFHSQHDPLTGLLNRRAFDAKLRAQSQDKGYEKRLVGAILVMDLNGFKPINDSYSHEAGDAVLRDVATRIKRQLLDGDLAARLGGDEFVIAVPSATTKAAAMERAAQLIADVSRPVPWNGKLLSVSASVGVALAHGRSHDPQLLLTQADQAMYKAKAEHSTCPVFYDPGQFTKRPTLDDRHTLGLAINDGEFVPYYQPKIDMQTGQIVGFEALARWELRNGRVMSPAYFIPLIDELGLQGDFVSGMIRSVLTDMDKWSKTDASIGQVSINLPEATLATKSARDDLLSAINEYPHLHEHIILEITEDVFIARAGDQIRESIRMLREAGLMVSLDDFGTGFASFRHLRELEFDEIKIDTSFVADLGHDPAADSVIKHLILIARDMDIQIIAEGVEFETQRNTLVQMGCKIAQGYLWDPALPSDEALVRLLEQPYLRTQPLDVARNAV